MRHRKALHYYPGLSHYPTIHPRHKDINALSIEENAQEIGTSHAQASSPVRGDGKQFKVTHTARANTSWIKYASASVLGQGMVNNLAKVPHVPADNPEVVQVLTTAPH